jgi:hypothetical protein
MSRVVTRGLRRQLELKASQQLVREMVQPREQPHSQVNRIQPIEVPKNELQQPITIKIPFHQILAE